jgi:Flp pilus assembly pilin Flp
MKKTFSGQSTMEYVIIIAVLAGAFVLIASAMKPKIRSSYNSLASAIQSKLD